MQWKSQYWYNKASCNTPLLEGAIILARMELLFNWLIVEKHGIAKASVTCKMDAATKIRQLLKLINVNSALPNNFKDLQLLNKNDAPESIIAIQNTLVDGTESKRKQLRNVLNVSGTPIENWVHSIVVIIYVIIIVNTRIGHQIMS